ncbi:gas vesicle protein K [Streptomyces cocklensis]|uniref:Gas vesicle protein K n=1 Tax=Actinacidiphila cocklensis TaxID=887465 RepID=A0A9W4GU14_9ACTN|nr:gas vesicle protein K [Actinacidiphila cocklensis]MDD1062108.1 gas vesicle protein K [Actinacidiphila cocklensis]WSX74515.1 gas vesicle protein K [Streptomyces sp. NBC_00899]CAG6396355.1 Gas vesicle protein K [Actinacidiphila cocklensis]
MTGSRVDLDADNAARDLVSLVLTLIELIRQLLERQAVRRLDQADLTPEQEERLGTALMHLDQAMTDLCAHHDLRREDLNLHLGPLGPLLAENPW